jgi:hypothetical protein
MKSRNKVFIQVKSKTTGRWQNYQSAKDYDEALTEMKKLQEKYPEATLRILDNNLTTHTN